MKILINIKSFKNYCNSYLCPEYIKRHISNLSEKEFVTFYNEIKQASLYLKDENYLFYKLFWILKHPYKDLTKELFYELLSNPEGYDLSKIINDQSFEKLFSIYFSCYQEDFLNL